jgi:hypothetical protein
MILFDILNNFYTCLIPGKKYQVKAEARLLGGKKARPGTIT